MKNKISLDLVTNSDQAIRGIVKTTKVQEELTRQVSKTKDESKALRSQMGNVSAYETQAKTLKTVSQQLEQTKGSMIGLAREMSQAKKPTQAQIKQLAKLEAQTSTLEIKEKSLEKRLASTRAELSKSGIKTNNLETAKFALQKRSQSLSRQLEKENALVKRSTDLQSRKAQLVQGLPSAGMVGASAAFAAGNAIRQNVQNQSQFSDAAKNLDFTGSKQEQEQQKEALRLQLNGLGRDIAGIDASGVMAIAAGGANGGIKTADIKQYVEDTAKTSVAWDMSANDSASKGTALRNSMNLDRDGFIEAADAINHLANKNGGVMARDLLGVMSRTGAIMTNAGLSLNESAALGAALLSKGASEEETGTATKNIVNAFTKGYAATGAQNRSWEMLGLDSVGVAQSMQTDAVGTMKDVFSRIKGLVPEEQNALITELFGDEAAPSVTKLVTSLGSFDKILGDISDPEKYKGSVDAEYAVKSGQSAAVYERGFEAVTQLSEAFGNRLNPIMASLVEPITGVIVGLTDFINTSDVAGTAIVGTIGVVVGGLALLKAYQGIKFARNIAGVIKESVELKKLSTTQGSAVKSTNNLSKATSNLSRNMDNASASDSDVGGNGKRRRKRGRSSRSRRRGGLLSRAAGLVTKKRVGLAGLGVGAMALPSLASATGLSESLDVGNDVVGSLTDGAEGLKAAGALRLLRPVASLLSMGSMASHAMDGDGKGTAISAGDFAGGTAGALAGGMAGAAMGSVVPFIGTAVGGAIGAALGGFGGGDIGARLAETVYNWFSSSEPKLSDDVYKAPLDSKKTDSQRTLMASNQSPSMTFSPVIQVTANTAEDATKIAQTLTPQMRDLFQQFLVESGLSNNQYNLASAHSLIG